MKTPKEKPHFVHIGTHLLAWYDQNARPLPFRKTKDPYKIWICEIIFQQTRIAQGMQHYENFIQRFPDVETLSRAPSDEVLLYWKGLGYYSRALNIHKAAQQIMVDFQGRFPVHYEDILSLRGVGKYTAAAIASICFGLHLPAIDGNYYRVLSRVFADDFDVSHAQAYAYFSELALSIIPENAAGDCNQAVMDLGSEICRPKKPLCLECPLKQFCLAFQAGKVEDYPVKTKKTKVSDLALTYYFIHHEKKFLVQQRRDDFIWKKLFEFSTVPPEGIEPSEWNSTVVKHKLTHKNLTITIYNIQIETVKDYSAIAKRLQMQSISREESHLKSFPKPLENFIDAL